MVSAMQKKSRAIFMMIMVGAIALTMLMFGIVPGQQGAIGGAAASVNGDVIHMKEYRRELSRTMQSFQNSQMQEQMLKYIRQNTLESLIRQKVQVQFAQRYGVGVSDEQVRANIIDSTYFQDPKLKSFSNKIYKSVLRQNRWTPREYEKLIRDGLTVDKTRKQMEMLSQLSDAEARQNHELENTRFVLRYAQVDASNFPASKRASKKQIDEFLAKKENDKKIQDAYYRNFKKYKKEKKVRASHIVFNLLPGADSAEKAELKKEAEAAHAAITKGMSWAAAVKKYSQDASTRKKGGSLGTIERNQPIKRYDQKLPKLVNAAYALKKGAVSKVVESKFGFHILRADSVTPGSSKPVSDKKVRRELAEEVLAQEVAESAFEEKKKNLDGRIKDLATLNRVLKNAGKNIELKSTSPFDLESEQVPGIPGKLDEIVEFLVTAKKGDRCPKWYQTDKKWLICAVEKVESPDEKELDDLIKEGSETASRAKFSAVWGNVLKGMTDASKIVRNESVLNPDV